MSNSDRANIDNHTAFRCFLEPFFGNWSCVQLVLTTQRLFREGGPLSNERQRTSAPPETVSLERMRNEPGIATRMASENGVVALVDDRGAAAGVICVPRGPRPEFSQ